MFLLNRYPNYRCVCTTHFNTSHVSIKPSFLRMLIYLIGISIHPMFLLNSAVHLAGWWRITISIHPMFLLNIMVWLSSSRFSYFNTSHVSIKLLFPILKVLAIGYFNTSHVSIKQRIKREVANYLWISIHPMFLLNQANQNAAIGAMIFQYIPCFY